MLLGIDFDYLILWGHYRLTIDLHHRLQGHLTDPWTTGASITILGACYRAVGQIQGAIEAYEQALAIYGDLGDWQGAATALAGLGLCYADLGQTARAIEAHEQALGIAREIGDRQGEETHLGNLGLCYFTLGQTARAIEAHEQAIRTAAIGTRARPDVTDRSAAYSE